MIEPEILKKLNAVPTSQFTSPQFLTDTSCYKALMYMEGLQVYLSECDFNTGENLELKNCISFYMLKGMQGCIVTMSNEFLLDVDIEVIKEFIKSNFK